MNLHPLTRAGETPKVSFLLLSGGVGARAAHHEPKQFYKLAGHPMLAHALIAAVRSPHVAEIVINTPEDYEARTAEIMKAYCRSVPFHVIKGGATRQESCAALVEAAGQDVVMLHEAARPFITPKMIADLVTCEAPNVGYCQAIAFSMCRIDSETRMLRAGVSREEVFDIQLPQKFDRQTLRQAQAGARAAGAVYNEESVMVVEQTGQPVQALEGSSRNRKVTTPEDFVIAQEMMKGFHSQREAFAHDT